ncbi:MAG: UDP-N-acetylmuramate dehydrogenase [Candidatus Bipolaricaulota bacterium]|nr:UDP-N-acetylmuramate dehydrogenase [Candidatus Bipolaricaulota bacterium]MCS7274443.1 UDP-N-acetylmuramate dehydrogenase [Candidatus Bipolaricaulota bacterium]MDW8110872.1 UDP-N-acetylmuramate dehydrogenase [Candidatus Bipolaricaulota bacterium]MDW8328647.1 UDP-N-acetylmuramate dehydrogenase [Candidatus Bipolaricaulota bacterium]
MASSERLRARLQERLHGKVKLGEPLSRHTSLRIGGQADYFVLPRSVEDICETISFAQEHGLAWRVIGNGTNILFPDEGVRGIVIKLGPDFGRIEIKENRMKAEAGASLAGVISAVRAQGSRELDFLVGIPASVGGALVMNAGIPECSISEVVARVRALTFDGKLITLERDDCRFGYRRSRFQEEKLIVIEGEFRIGSGRSWDGAALLARRRERQPLGVPSPGCVFKNPPAAPPAGQLIDQAGLKGYRVGGAVISAKHANFIINEGGATSRDVLQLIDIARSYVLKYFGVELQLELAVVA